MAEKRDAIDDIIDIREGLGRLLNPFGGLTGNIADPASAERFDPSAYKEKPRPNSVFCLRCSASSLVDQDVADRTCSLCLDICPVDAIEINKASVRVRDACRMCGLCTMVCPTESFVVQRLMARQLYDKMVRAASTYERCYVTCTRALGRLPRENEVLLPCVGAVPRELWLSLVADFDNISVYLPSGICDRCRTTTGEDAYTSEISTAEEWSRASVGFESDMRDLNHEQARSYRRGQFIDEMRRVSPVTFATASDAPTGAQAVTKRIRDHADQLYNVQRSLEDAVGDKSVNGHRRILTQKRKTVLGMLQAHPTLAGRMRLEVPVCDLTRCTMCGICVRECPVNACDLDGQGHFSVRAAYCVNCGACATVCPENVLTMEPCDPRELIVLDVEAERRRRSAAKRMERHKRATETGKRRSNRALGARERVAGN